MEDAVNVMVAKHKIVDSAHFALICHALVGQG